MRKWDELLLVCENNIDTLTDKTKTRPQGKYDFKIAKSRVTFSPNKPLKLEEEKLMLCVTSLEVNSSVFILTKDNIRLTIYTTGLWGKL